MSLFLRESDGSKLKFDITEVPDAQLKNITKLIEINGGDVGEDIFFPIRFIPRKKYKNGLHRLYRLYDINFIATCVRKGRLVDLKSFRLGPEKVSEHCVTSAFLYGVCTSHKIISTVLSSKSWPRKNPLFDMEKNQCTNVPIKIEECPARDNRQRSRCLIDESQAVELLSGRDLRSQGSEYDRTVEDRNIKRKMSGVLNWLEISPSSRSTKNPEITKKPKYHLPHPSPGNTPSTSRTQSNVMKAPEEPKSPPPCPFPGNTPLTSRTQSNVTKIFDNARAPMVRTNVILCREATTNKIKEKSSTMSTSGRWTCAPRSMEEKKLSADYVRFDGAIVPLLRSNDTDVNPVSAKPFIPNEYPEKTGKHCEKTKTYYVFDSTDSESDDGREKAIDIFEPVCLISSDEHPPGEDTTPKQNNATLEQRFNAGESSTRIVERTESGSNSEHGYTVSRKIIGKRSVNNVDTDLATTGGPSVETDNRRTIVPTSSLRSPSTGRARMWRSNLHNSYYRSDNRPTRQKYTRNEQQRMIDYLLEFDDIVATQPKGLKIWELMVKKGILQHRTPQSLQNNFIKFILPNIHAFEMTDEQREQFKFLTYPRDRRMY